MAAVTSPRTRSPRRRSARARRGSGDDGGGPRAQLAEIQRARILAAATQAVAELGYAGLTVSEVISRARISRRTFYEFFADREECFLAAFDVALARVAEPVLAAYLGAAPHRPSAGGEDAGRPDASRERANRSHGTWRERVSAALGAMLALFDEQPAAARLLVVDALAAGPVALERRAAVFDALVAAVEDGRGAARGREPGPLAGEAVVGAVLSVLHTRLLEPDRREPLSGLLGPLMNAIVLPYLGPAAAARELKRPVPPTYSPTDGRRRAGRHANPLHGLDMRLTYRTLRVLSAVGELSGRGSDPSNRAVADAAGIADAGQMSKLLARLQGLGLIENSHPARARGAPLRGEPNRWTLTPRGAEVVEAIRDRPNLAGRLP
jgi:AcrR family transcriptional regulator